MSDQIKYVAKAIVGALIAALAAAGGGLVNGGLDTAGWIAVATAFLVAFAGVYWTTNGAKP